MTTNRYRSEQADLSEASSMLNLVGTICGKVGKDAVVQLSRVHKSGIRTAAAADNLESCLPQAKHRLDIEERSYAGTQVATTGLASAYCDLGVAHSLNREYSKAVPLFHQSIEMHKQIPRHRIPIPGSYIYIDSMYCPLYHLALASWYQGEHEDASAFLLEVLHEREQTHGVNDPYPVL